MDYEQAVEYINSFLVFGSKPGLSRIENLLNILGNPQKKLQFIHVAGTNGKGSVCEYISCILQQCCKKVGKFTSPFVVDFAERFQINGKNISHADLCSITARVKAAVDTLPENMIPTEFELITAIAMLWFYEQQCNVVVLEVGLGGLYDSTNVIDTPLCSVICSISLDHTAILGDTVEEIAVQKCGIIKPGGKTVVYPVQQDGVLEVVENAAKAKENELILPDTDAFSVKSRSICGTGFSYFGKDYFVKMLGVVQPYNAITAIEAVKTSFANIDESAIINGLKSAYLPARCEVVESKRPIILDGAHNPDGVLSLKGILDEFVHKNGKKVTAVIGMMKDKDIDTVLCEMGGCFDEILTVTVNNPRAISADELAKKAKKYCQNVTACESLKQAAQMAINNDFDNAVVFCGSFYMMAQLKDCLPYDI